MEWLAVGGRLSRRLFFFFFFNDTATTEIYTLSLHDALPIWRLRVGREGALPGFERIAAEADTAGRVVLQDGDRRLGQLPELLGEREGGVDVDHIIVGELLPVERLGHTEELALPRRGPVRGLAGA